MTMAAMSGNYRNGNILQVRAQVFSAVVAAVDEEVVRRTLPRLIPDR
jgi:hypothetical protein